MYKLIAIDMDGTLLDPSGQITDKNKQAIQEAKAQGVNVVLASGRPITGMQAALNELGLNTKEDYVISYNGALVQEALSAKVLHQEVLDYSTVKQIAAEAKRLGLEFHAFSTELGLITPNMNPWTQHECDINGIDVQVIDLEDMSADSKFLKAMIVADKAALDTNIPNIDAQLVNQINMVRTADFFLEFMPQNISKWAGIEALLSHLELSASQVMALGDQGNDKQMIEHAGLGVAMENAVDEVKAVADVITTSNQESGVGVAIEKYVLTEKAL